MLRCWRVIGWLFQIRWLSQIQRTTLGERNRNLIHPIVVRITAVAFHVGERHIIQPRGIQGFPEILIEHRLAGRSLPALALPALDPGAEAIDQIFAVGAQGEIRMTR